MAVPMIAAASALIDPSRYPLAVILGGVVGILHLRGISLTSRVVTMGAQATGLLWFFSIFRLFFVFAALAALVKFGQIDVLGLLAGFMIVTGLVLVEGWIDARNKEDSPPPSPASEKPLDRDTKQNS